MASNNAGPKSVAKPYFTDYTIAGMCERSAELRAAYDQERRLINLQRSLKVMSTRTIHAQSLPRGGFPCVADRQVKRLATPSKRKMPHSGFLKRFKSITKLNNLPPYVRVKIWVLHATRGWKVYA